MSSLGAEEVATKGGESALDITQELSKYRVDSSWFPALWSHTAYRTLL